jgi:hypothetical protein
MCGGETVAGVPVGREHSLGQLIDPRDGCFGLLCNRCFRHRDQILSVFSLVKSQLLKT